MHSYLKCATTHKESACHHFLPPPAQVNNLLHPRHHFPGQTSLNPPTPSHPVSGPQHMTHILPEVKVHQHNHYVPIMLPLYCACRYDLHHGATVKGYTYLHILQFAIKVQSISPAYCATVHTRPHVTYYTHVNISCNMNQCS